MDVIAGRMPTRNSAGWLLQQRRENEFGFVDRPLEAGVDKNARLTISAKTRDALKHIDLRAIRPHDLKMLGQTLLQEGHISRLAQSQFALMTFDLKPGPIDALAMLRNDLRTLKGVNDNLYGTQLEMYQAAIGALEGMKAAIEMPLIDTYA